MIRIYNKNGVVLNTKDKYCTENIEVAIDTTNLLPENIVAGKTILGVTGTTRDGSLVYDDSIIIDGEAHVISSTKPICTDIIIIANPRKDTDKISINYTPTSASVYADTPYFEQSYHHTRFYFDVPEEAAGSSCTVRIVYGPNANSGAPFAGVGKLDTVIETGSSSEELYIATRQEHLSEISSRTCSYTFTNLTVGRHFVETQVISYPGNYASMRAMWTLE